MSLDSLLDRLHVRPAEAEEEDRFVPKLADQARELTVEPDEFALAAEIRDRCLRWLELHRAHCPETSCVEPAGFLAFLAHSMGATERQLTQFPRLLLDYDMRCDGCGSQRDEVNP